MSLLNEVLAQYRFQCPEAKFIRHNENMTYSVADGEKKYLLRIHKEAEGLDFSFQCGGRPRASFIAGEMELLNLLSEKMTVQKPIKNRYGEYLTQLKTGETATVLTWLEGSEVTARDKSEELAFHIGAMIGRLHNTCSELPKLDRYRYDDTMCAGVLHEITEGYEKGHIEEGHYKCISCYLMKFGDFLSKKQDSMILVHCDFSESNIILHKGLLVPIDFSLSGYSLPEMDIADMICSLDNEGLVPGLLRGYRSESRFGIHEEYVDVYRAFSVVMYIAYHHHRFPGEDNEKLSKNLDRWCETLFSPALEKLESICDSER